MSYKLACVTADVHQLPLIDKLALVFSGLCHDVSHTGRTNPFECNSRSKLSIRYHDKSVINK